MCGIAGYACFRGGDAPDPGLLKAMCDTLVHRGPDGEGMDIRHGVAMGMRRLSVIDLAGGGQPIFNEDGSVRVVYNGEIYNYRELRGELVEKGHRFSTGTDTEVIVHGYEEYGVRALDRFNGMFAFVLHDMKRGKLLLARDHLGIKPLYYAVFGGRLLWGSEIKALLATGIVQRELEVGALSEFLSWEYVPGNRTLFKGVYQLSPGSMMEIDLADPQLVERAYWDVPVNAPPLRENLEECMAAVEAKVAEATRAQLVGDVPVGAFLSGGVDSSLMVAAMGPARTFSIGFDDASYNELHWARMVASHLGVEHRDAVIRPRVGELFQKLIHHMDDPIGDFSIFPTYLVSAHARRDVTVALSGDGGDELFGGYETYVADGVAGTYLRLPGFLRNRLIEPLVASLGPRPRKKGLVNKARRFVEGLGHPPGLCHARWRLFAGEGIKRRLFTPEARKAAGTPSHITTLFKRAEGLSPLNRKLYVDLKSYLVDNCLVKTDRMSMAASLETRVPYLDRGLVELAFRIPEELKVSGTRTKILLKRVAAKKIPRRAVYRPKEGFSIPIKNWLKKELRPLMETLLEPGRIGEQGVLNPSFVQGLKKEHLEGRGNNSHLLWSIMVYQAWRERWLDGARVAGLKKETP